MAKDGVNYNNQQVHICLISDQTLANLLPLLLECPSEAMFLVSDEMGAQAGRLRRLAEQRGILVREERIPAYGIAGVAEVCQRLLDRYSPGRLTLNVTGGTKLSALAAFETFYGEKGTRIIYVNTADDCLLTLWPNERSDPLPELLTVPDYLAAYGARVRQESGRPPIGATGRDPLTIKLAKMLANEPKLLKTLNTQASPYVDDRKSPPKPYLYIAPGVFPDRQKAATLLNLLTDGGLATPGLDGGVNVNRKDPNGREEWFYLGGGWLEEFVYNEVGKLEVFDRGINVEVDWENGGGQERRPPLANEFDVLFTHRNRLHLISCKTANPKRENAEGTSRALEAINELDSLADRAGGLFGRAMLVSAHRLREVDLDRARSLKIEVVHSRQMLQLGAALRLWLGPSSPPGPA